MTTHVRFAPSPTGKLHVGNARTAILTWLFARKTKGHFLLRIDDTDVERSSEENTSLIQKDLTWLGMNWDSTFKQSDRMDHYTKALEKLKESGRAYACYETADELALKRKVQLNRGLPPVYDREALTLSAEQIAQYEKEGRKPHWRFKLVPGLITWNDHVRGPQQFDAKDISDPVLVREDGRVLYTLSSVVDDCECEITHILRGEDHVTNTATQIQLFEALGGKVPEFGHMPLISDKEGKGLSKRLGSMSIESLREEEGIEPLAILSFLAKLGTSDAIEVKPTLEHLIDEFDMDKISRATPKFDPDELLRLNGKLVKTLSYESVKPRLIQDGFGDIPEDFWNAIVSNLERVSDVEEWWHMARQEIAPVIEDKSFSDLAASLLPAEPWDINTWNQWVEEIKKVSDRKGKTLFMPLRQALTGKEHGPELKNLLPLIGREKALLRLQGAKA
ncbi:MAG: glutamate--tRNA ligase [Alphaproteobacteria bacterium]|jgi:glutamyl-tRNA synthetase|nr:glutamate--tRNA ligase [Alphaproteobacteria bacterium]MBP9877892.1 glutamate--tRNA ligase [Alphaproteobacteria bacterium]